MGLIGACTAFGAICGSSVATTATFARAALPEFERYRYDAGFATGAIAVGGTLGILIPPSVILVVYGISTEQNIAKLFMAAFIPGFMAAIFYCIVIALVVRRRPELGRLCRACRWTSDCATSPPCWPALLVALVVLGGIYGGIFSPTEGAAVGVIAMLIVAVGVVACAGPGAEGRAAADRRDRRHDLLDPVGRRRVQRLPGAVAASRRRGRMDRRLGLHALRRDRR